MKHAVQNAVLGLNPLTYLVFSTCILVAVISVNDIAFNMLCFGLMVLIATLAGKSKKYLVALAKGIFSLIALMFLLQSLMYQGASEILWHWEFLSVKRDGVIYAASLSTVLLDISGAVILMFLLTDVKKLVRVCEHRGLPPKAAYVVLSTLQIIPQMGKRSKTIMDAQRSRGVETEGGLLVRTKAFLPMLIPLVLNSIISIEERALMLEARAFSYETQKTHLTVPHDTKTDINLRKAFVVLTAVIVLARIILWIS